MQTKSGSIDNTIAPRQPAPKDLHDLEVANVTPTAAAITVKVGGARNGRLYSIVLANGAPAPSTPQIVAATDGGGSTATRAWHGNGAIEDFGNMFTINMPGPFGLDIQTHYDLYLVHRYADNNFSSILTASFTTAAAAPSILSQTPSHGYELASLTDNIVWVFDQPITLVSGNIVLHDIDTDADVETFNAATLVGNQGGTLKLSTTNRNNDTLIISLGVSLTPRRHYAITVAPDAIDNGDGSQSFVGVADYTTYTFRAKYAESNARKLAGANTNIMAWSLDDDSLYILNAGNDYDGTWGAAVTRTGFLTKSPKGMRFTTANYAEIATRFFGYSNSQGTIILECSARDFDTEVGTAGNANSVVGLVKSVASPTAIAHFLQISKSDSSTRRDNLQVVYRRENGTVVGKEIGTPGGQFPVGGVMGIIGITWDLTECIVFDAHYSAVQSGGTWILPVDFTHFRWGPIAGTMLYFDILRGYYVPAKLTIADAQSRVYNFRNFVSA